ncbi:hypothetical protein BKA93DRAFT_203494 [Sparassis latifolia]|uniref:Uncharacterized protein n=1 Tax=Sparassis crispa TaxID=139825 RepID=A0A401G8X3_9APHY|nr:hypothetical protein SCP_0115150 [Sparassis crispa]GBE78626.1 hypothetical protein SCP_0115150 [Sparassis crispa]
MGRHVIEQGAIEIAYGTDHATGYFLSVVDARLAWSEDATDAVNAVAEGLCAHGGGSYFDLHTGPGGFGRKVDVATLMTFWQRYGVPAQHVQLAKLGNFF